ncbi:MAG: bifunctional DNA-formamidopyrimidine glycosylase/DNA-(apurinic or apyrimidinic site) lyase [Nitrospira sp.]|nr:bifunctional DNA-formamidopyrimidine glycosylase/DNA-(apurinic or apyrimidinic site) lyase [Nitrospira sp.]
MPELPEAEVVTRQIRAKLTGCRVRELWIGRADIVRQGYTWRSWYVDARLDSVTRYGKSIAIAFVKGGEIRYLVVELGMTGLLLFSSVAIKLPQHIHARLVFDGGKETELRYWNPRRFGRLRLLDQGGLDQYVRKRFGSDPLSVTLEDFTTRIGDRRGRLKSLLMQQQVIAGIGNIYANEILFRAGLHPHARANKLAPSSRERLYHVTRAVLTEAIACGGSSVRDFFAPDGGEGCYKRYHRVYGKTGQPCPNRCGATIRHLKGERSSFYCPRCQRWR